MSSSFIFAAIAALGLFTSVALIPARMAWAGAGTARPASGGWWILAILAVCMWWFTTSAAFRAHAKGETAAALAELKVASAAEILKEPDAWMNVPVVVTDVAYCKEKMADPDAGDALATRVTAKGEEEYEGEERDYVDYVKYGTEEDVVKFTLGGPESKLRVDDEGWTVLPAGPAVTKTIDTGEFAAAAGRNLQDIEERRSIMCGATVSVAGVLIKEGEFLVLDNLPKNLAILTDRPWKDVVSYAADRASSERRSFWFWFVMAAFFGLGQLAGAMMARGKA